MPRTETREKVWGKRIRAARRSRGLTLRQLAPLLGVSHAAVDRWERGVNGPSDALKVSIASWAGEDPDEMFSLKAGR